jgi:hypothetical protein
MRKWLSNQRDNAAGIFFEAVNGLGQETGGRRQKPDRRREKGDRMLVGPKRKRVNENRFSLRT